MVNVELRLLALMLKTGDFRLITQGDLTEHHILSEQGRRVFDFIKSYRQESDGKARYPSLVIARDRHSPETSGIELPDPDPSDTLEALFYETNVQRIKAKTTAIARQLEVAADSADDPTPQITQSVGELRKLSESMLRSRHLNLAEAFDDVLMDYDAGDILPLGMPWPWSSLQKVTRGMHKKEFVVLAGRPKARKTFVALHIGVHAFAKHGARVLVFTPEMPAKQVLLRSVAFLCQLRYAEFKEATLDDAETMRLLEAAREYGISLSESNKILFENNKGPSFDIIESAGRSVAWMESQIESFCPDIVVADSFYKHHYGNRKYDADWKAVTATSQGMKEMAMSTNTCIIGTHHVNRGSENAVGTLSNLSLADAIGKDADLVLRVITGKMEIEGILSQVSALVNLGGREIPFEGILINNVPCCNFEEIGPITNKSTIERLMKEEDSKDAEEENSKLRKRSKKSPLRKHRGGKNTEEKESVFDSIFDVEDEEANGG